MPGRQRVSDRIENPQDADNHDTYASYYKRHTGHNSINIAEKGVFNTVEGTGEVTQQPAFHQQIHAKRSHKQAHQGEKKPPFNFHSRV
jgi:hypothetical protein